ncbi:MAG: hypothetical protein ACI3VD_05950 [Candidatus Limivicinus sp.]
MQEELAIFSKIFFIDFLKKQLTSWEASDKIPIAVQGTDMAA